jgi:hypothetical protein
MRQRRPASAALTGVAGTRPAVRCTQMLARTPKRDSTPSACSDVWFICHLDWHAAGAQAPASVAPRVVRLDRGAGHRSSLRTQRPQSRSRWTHISSFERLQQHHASSVAPLTHASAAAGQRRLGNYRGQPARRPLHAIVRRSDPDGLAPQIATGAVKSWLVIESPTAKWTDPAIIRSDPRQALHQGWVLGMTDRRPPYGDEECGRDRNSHPPNGAHLLRRWRCHPRWDGNETKKEGQYNLERPSGPDGLVRIEPACCTKPPLPETERQQGNPVDMAQIKATDLHSEPLAGAAKAEIVAKGDALRLYLVEADDDHAPLRD